MTTAKQIKEELINSASPEKANSLRRFFRTGKGEYGEGDKFIGTTVLQQRTYIKNINDISLSEIQNLLEDEYHECRMTALLLLVKAYKKSKKIEEKEDIYKFYLSHTKYINNWDLVDLSCSEIVGDYLSDKNREQLYKLAHSGFLWEERISIISTFYFIKRNDFEDTFKIADILLHHKHDLIHKAVGWMLREVGKRDFDAEYHFLTADNRYQTMPRTMLRYAIEKYPEELRQAFLKGTI